MPGVLHRAGVELRDEHLVVGVAERVAAAEHLLLQVEARPRDREQLVGLEVRRERAPAPDAELDRRRARPARRARARRPASPGRSTAARSARTRASRRRPASPRVFASTRQPSGARDREPTRRLEVGLVEAGEDPLRVVEEGLRVDVDLAVGRVDGAVQPLAGAGRRAAGRDRARPPRRRGRRAPAGCPRPRRDRHARRARR